MLKRTSVKNLLIQLYMILMLFYVYASAVGISVKLILVCSFVCLSFFAIKARCISINTGEWLWLMCVAVMFVWTRRIDSEVIYYNSIFLITWLVMIVLQARQLKIDFEKVFKLFLIGAALSVLLVFLELILQHRMSGFLSLFLPPAALQDELLYISAKTGLRGLASSTNAVSMAAFVILTYGIYFLKTDEKSKRIICIAISIIVLIVCGERSNFIFVPIAFLFVYIVCNPAGKGLKYIKLLLFILIVFAFLTMITPQLEQIPALKRMFRTINHLQSGEDISGERAILYGRAIEMWKERPIFGHGWFEFYFQNNGIIKAGSNSYVHNLLLEAMAETGLVGTCLIFCPIIYSVLLNLKLLKKARSRDSCVKIDNYLCFTLSFQVFFILDSMLHLTFFSPRVILYIICLAFLYNIERRIRNEIQKK